MAGRTGFARGKSGFCLRFFVPGNSVRSPECGENWSTPSSERNRASIIARRIKTKRSGTLNLSNSAETWNLTVRSETFNRAAISLFDRLRSTHESTSRSRAVRLICRCEWSCPTSSNSPGTSPHRLKQSSWRPDQHDIIARRLTGEPARQCMASMLAAFSTGSVPLGDASTSNRIVPESRSQNTIVPGIRATFSGNVFTQLCFAFFKGNVPPPEAGP